MTQWLGWFKDKSIYWMLQVVVSMTCSSVVVAVTLGDNSFTLMMTITMTAITNLTWDVPSTVTKIPLVCLIDFCSIWISQEWLPVSSQGSLFIQFDPHHAPGSVCTDWYDWPGHWVLRESFLVFPFLLTKKGDNKIRLGEFEYILAISNWI